MWKADADVRGEDKILVMLGKRVQKVKKNQITLGSTNS
jgi:hypothetical protein